MGWGARTGATVAVVLALAAGYLTADAHDVVPGMLTLDPPHDPPAPFPTAPGAVDAPPPTRTLEPLSDDAPLPTASEVERLVATLAADNRLGPRVGVLVRDALTGETLGASAATSSFVPASTLKLLTAAAALESPGAQVTLPTTVVQPSADTLVLVGGGDMMLAAGEGDPDAVNGRAGLGDLAHQVSAELRLTGRTTVRLLVDDTLFTGPSMSPSWHPNTARDGWGADVAALAVDIARVGDGEYAPRSADPALAAAEVFVAELAERGVEVVGSPTRGPAPTDAPTIAEVHSAPLGEVVEYFLQRSDNTITELVGRIVALDAGLPGSAQAATEAVRASVERLGVDLTGAVTADGSGLGDGSSLSAEQLVDVLALLTDPAHPALLTGATGLPVGGLSGTLDERFLQSAGRGVVRAKTGSLPNVTSLAGTVVTDDGRLLLFAILADEVPDGGTWGARLIFDAFVGSLAECGCQGEIPSS